MPAGIDPRSIAGHDPATPVVAIDGRTMGTRWRVLFARPPGCAVDAVRLAVDMRLAELVAEMSHWQPDSLLCRFNRSPAGTWTTLPPDFALVVATALDVAAKTDGAFDPAVGRLVDLWGFGPPGPVAAPSPGMQAQAHAAAGWRRLAWNAASSSLRQPGGLALDLSGIAKGYAADAVATLLRRSGIRHALVEVGGELVGLGIRPDADPWWVELETPPDADLPPLRVALHGIAVATSGNYIRGNHTLDPRTGTPVTSGVAAISVIAPTAMIADVWATALTVVSDDTRSALVQRHGLAVRAVTRVDGGWREWISPALERMMFD